jgi:tetratricopeptide (TPR) repeat protein
MLGFGFNKTKVLASAEKNVKQGRLQNAIADYERILKEDADDLNVLNTIGDLYARVGNLEQATAYFQRVGDAYASEGFTVKAIAMYKKLTKQNPHAVGVILKLGDLYAQQGLNNDARVQYSAAAEHHLHSGETEAAATVYQKMLDLDPDNPQTQGRLAELYGRLGKKAEARDVYFRSAQTLRARGALEACDEALGHVLKLDPGLAQAILLRGQVRLEGNNAPGAVQCLEMLPDLDSRPEALRVLLRARLKLNQYSEAEPVARKLLVIFNDVSGVTAYGEALLAAGDYEAALQCYDEFSTQLLTANAAGLMDTLHKMIGPLKTNSHALETLSALFQKAGNTSHLAEVTELLAHASVQEGSLEKARDLYQQLAEMEPENPLHLQNYNQIQCRLEAGSGVSLLHSEEEQALMAEELDEIGSAVEQKYSDELGAALQNAFTDAELFESYNLLARAILPLEAMLPRAPRDLQLNRRLTSLYVRANRLAEAARCCQVLEAAYKERGGEKEAAQFAELAAKYAAQSEVSIPSGESRAESGASAPTAEAETVPSPVLETALETAGGPPASQETLPTDTELPSPAAEGPEVPAPPLAAEPVPQAGSQAHEIDLSEEWERVLAAEQSEATPPKSERALAAEESPAAPAPNIGAVTDAALGDLLEEARFYLAQSMVDEARAALARAEAVAPKAPAVLQVRAQLDEFSGKADKLELAEIEIVDVSRAVEVPPAAPPEPPSAEPEPVAAVPEPALETEPAAPAPEGSVSSAAVTAPAPSKTTDTGDLAVAAKPKSADLLSDFVMDLEESLGNDYALAPPTTDSVKRAAPSVRSAKPAPAEALPPPPQGKVPVPDTAGAGPQVALPAREAASLPPERLDQHPERARHSVGGLSGLFAAFKEEVESDSGENDDPEIHYNLGVAFKEMGLLDEAIGELQKVCKAIEHNHAFTQVIEAYTWLADCFVQNGMPEAAIHWYEKALQAPGLDQDGVLAIHYELACAYEAAGDVAAARSHFMRVLSDNIDYRDVAERIKTLRS